MFQNNTLWIGVISGGVSQVKDIQNYMRGQLDGKHFAIHTTGNVTGSVGIMAGIEYGAMLGSALLPGVGTIVGSIAGAMLGDRVGRAVGIQAGQLLFRGERNATGQPVPVAES